MTFWDDIDTFSDKLPVPTEKVTDAPVYCIPINAEWLTMMSGALAFMREPRAWDYANDTELQFALQNVETLIALLQDWQECVVPVTYTIQKVEAYHVLAQNTAGGSTVAGVRTVIPFNTLAYDETGSATLEANVLTLPAGLWRIQAEHSFRYGVASTIRVALNLGALSHGCNDVIAAGAGQVERVDVLTNQVAAFTVSMDYYASQAQATNGLGLPINEAGYSELYGKIIAERFIQT